MGNGKAGAGAGNGLADLTALIFDQIRDLRDPELSGDALKREVERARAVNELSVTAVKVADTTLHAISMRNRAAIDADVHSDLRGLTDGAPRG